MKRTMAAKILLASGTAALALGAAACEIEDPGPDGGMDDGGGILDDDGGMDDDDGDDM